MLCSCSFSLWHSSSLVLSTLPPLPPPLPPPPLPPPPAPSLLFSMPPSTEAVFLVLRQPLLPSCSLLYTSLASRHSLTLPGVRLGLFAGLRGACCWGSRPSPCMMFSTRALLACRWSVMGCSPSRLVPVEM